MPDVSIDAGSGVFGYLPVSLQAIGAFTNLVGSFQSASAARISGQRAQVEAQFEAAQLKQQAGQAEAAGTYAADEQVRQTALIQSKALAVAAANGGGVSDPTIVNLLSRNAGEGAYRAAVALYDGESRARSLNMQAASKIYEGQLASDAAGQKAKGYEIGGVSKLFGTGASLFANYAKVGGDGPNRPATKSVGSGDSAQIQDWGG